MVDSEAYISLGYFSYRFFKSVVKTAEPLLGGQRAGGGVESAIKSHSVSFTFPILFSIKTQKVQNEVTPCRVCEPRGHGAPGGMVKVPYAFEKTAF